MAKEKRTRVDRHLGRVSNADAHALPPGANQLQDNLQCAIEGQMTVREGIQKQTSFIPSSPGSDDNIAIFAFNPGFGAYLVTHDTGGTIDARRGSTNTTIASSRSTFTPMSFARTPTGELIGVDGMSRGIFWNGTSASAWPLGITAPSSAPTIATPVGGAATAGDYYCAYRYVDISVPTGKLSSLSSATTATAATNDKFEWTGLVASTEVRITGTTARRGAVELWRSASGAPNVFYKIVSLVHNGTITSTADSGGFQQHTVPTGHGIVVGQRITIAGASHASVNVTQQVSASAATTITTTTAFSATATGGTWVTEGYMSDTSSDNTLILNAIVDETARLVVIDSQGDLGARRFVPPPKTKQHVVIHQRRAFYLADVLYNEGTVTTDGDTTIVGSGTSWTTDMAGRYITIDGEPYPLLISSVGSATAITLATACVTTASGKSYMIRPSATERNAILYSEEDEPESVPATNLIVLQTDPNDDDELVGGFSLGSVLYVTYERHIHSVVYAENPLRDGSADLLQNRGAVNKRAVDLFEGQAYLMDALGVYSMSAGGDIEVGSGQEVQDLFRDATVDQSKAKWFFVQADPRSRIIRYFVTNAGDTSTRPTRCIAMSTFTGRWWTEHYQEQFGGATKLAVSGVLKPQYAGEDDRVWAHGDTSDGVSSIVTGTVTSAGTTTLTDSGASFASGQTLVGASGYIYSGTSKGSEFRVVSRDSGTVLTITPSTTTDTTSKYAIGAIPWSFRTGQYDLTGDQSWEVVFDPTTGDSRFDVRALFNHASSIDTNVLPVITGKNFYRDTTNGDLVVSMCSVNATAILAGFGSGTIGYVDVRLPYTPPQTGFQGRQWVALDFRGYQGDEAVRIHYVNLKGVQ